jgi:hypothetical protein
MAIVNTAASIGFEPLEVEIGVDTAEVGVLEEGASTYPAPDQKRVGVTTNAGTNPAVTDQGDEATLDIWRTPDDVGDIFEENRIIKEI